MSNDVGHADRGHARLSCSASGRWISCPGSIKLIEDVRESGNFKEKPSSEAAEIGTALHEAAEFWIERNLSPLHAEFNHYEITADLLPRIETYVQYVQSLPGITMLEQQVKYSDDVWGTADCLNFHDDTLLVCDYKSGKGVLVDAENNTQLQIYALAALNEFGMVFDQIDIVKMVIVQNEDISEWEITIDELRQFEKDSLIPAVEAIGNKTEKCTPSEGACRWCQVQTICPEMKRITEELALQHLPLTEKALTEANKILPMVKAWVKAVESDTKDTLLNGGEVLGFKVVEGRRSRKWTDDDEALSFLRKNGKLKLSEATKSSVITVAQAEKLLKGKTALPDLMELVVVKEGNPTVVPDSDKRPALSNTDAFDDLT